MHHGPVSPEIAQGLKALKKRIADAGIPPSKLDETINVAVWNIREFGKKARSKPALHYIAEILGQFDLIAIVELRDRLDDLAEVMVYLGETWDVVYCDWMGDAGGNRERVAYLYDRRSVSFNGLAAEIDAPRAKQETEYLAAQSFWRAPYLCSFRAGNFDFLAIAMHARWGDDLEGRRAELQLLAEWIKTRFADKYAEDTDLLVMGDFNVPDLGDKFFQALTSGGLVLPKQLEKIKLKDRVIGGTNLEQERRYDQILHLPTFPANAITAAGSLDFFVSDASIEQLFPGKKMTRTEFTFQMSDHLPLWVQLKVDIDGFRLNQIIRNARK